MTMYQLKKSGMETVETGTPTHKLNTIDSLHTEGIIQLIFHSLARQQQYSRGSESHTDECS